MLRILLLLAALLAAAPAHAADSPTHPAAGEIDQLIERIENPEKRAQLLNDLKTLRATADRPATPPGPPAEAAVAKEQEEAPLGNYLLSHVIDRVQAIVWKVNAAAGSLGDVDRLTEWFGVMATDPARRNLLLTAIGQLLLLLAIGMVAAYALGRLIRMPFQNLESRTAGGPVLRFWIAVARLVLGILPIAGLVLAMSLVQAWLEPGPRTRVLASDAINAIAISAAADLVLRAILSPSIPKARPVPLSDEAAAYLYVWLRRFVRLGVYGFFVLEGFRHLGMPDAAHELLANLCGLALAGLGAVFIQQNRGQVAVLIRGRTEAARQRFSSLRARFADVWHLFALFYIAALYLIWALEVKGGFELMVRGTIGSVATILLAWAFTRALVAALRRLLAVNRELIAGNPFLERRANLYLPALESGVAWTVRVLALLAILAAWRVDVAGVLGSDTARLVWSRLIGIVFVLLLAFLIWEAISGFVTSYLARRDAEGNLLVRGARARTLLPLFNNALRVVVGAIATLMVLSQLGIDIAPLLAGAGVVGLAVGFGSQKLVQDVITGVFLLIEDAVNVGDVVSINGTTGTIESLTIRAVSLRDGEGTLHTIPFGSINQVSNQTRTFSYAVLTFTVPSEAAVDPAILAADKAFADLKDDPKLAPDIMRDMEVQGVDRMDAAGLTVRLRIRTRPGRQWGVKRAFNRAIARRFGEAEVKLV